MEILGSILMVVGGLGALACGIWMLILQFQSSILWGLACIFVPFVALIWLAIYWEDGKYPFLYALGFYVLLFGGSYMAGQEVPLLS